MEIKYGIDNFAVVSHTVGGQLIYIGTVRLAQVFDLRFAEQSMTWRQAVALNDGRVSVEVLNVFEKRPDALKYAFDARVRMKPAAWSFHAARRRVKCLTDGSEYVSATAAAEAFGISKGAMSNHLNRREGYAVIHGMTFEWVDTRKMEHMIDVAVNGVQVTYKPAPEVTDIRQYPAEEYVNPYDAPGGFVEWTPPPLPVWNEARQEYDYPTRADVPVPPPIPNRSDDE